MSEYIIEWSGIGARITELVGSETPCLAVKHLREERLREEIVRCRDCCCCHTVDSHELCIRFNHATNYEGFCAWGARREP